MKTSLKKKIALSALGIVLLSGAAHANDLINNQASGTVGLGINPFASTISQNANDGSETRLEVGSIAATDASDNFATGQVDGVVTQEAFSIHGDGAKAIAQVGAVRANNAFGNTATGFVAGDITQTTDLKADARVGSIEAETPQFGGSFDSTAMNNQAFGNVSGAIEQVAFNNSTAVARVGSIAPQ